MIIYKILSGFKPALYRTRNIPALIIGGVLVLFFLFLAIMGPVIAPYDAFEFHHDASLASPSKLYLFGTDQFGRDIFSRVIVGTRSIIVLGTLSTTFAVVIGVLIGLISGYKAGMFDEIVMRLLDGIMAIPTLLTVLLVLAVFGSSTFNVILSIGIVFVPVIARVTRSAVLDVLSLEYVQIAKVRGESARYIMFREILPNIYGTLAVEASIRFSFAILAASALGFLGMGVQPPTPDWGLMASEGRNFVMRAPWMVVFPGLAIATLVVGVNLLVDGLREYLETDFT